MMGLFDRITWAKVWTVTIWVILAFYLVIGFIYPSGLNSLVVGIYAFLAALNIWERRYRKAHDAHEEMYDLAMSIARSGRETMDYQKQTISLQRSSISSLREQIKLLETIKGVK